ncbi:hypothetical protein DM806_05805 [Sphingobium lactosutens]|uniref:hypothetical protein n=1 Tax=Sphingobium lactosutens TaxID=522773 RepID=UPI0015BE0D4F|nr:hypothetical protein [Sphingobium lactosutens]NWK95185.1 hypothetical protein [Sphingobium lactosutens]
MQKFLQVITVIIVGVIVMFGGRWYMYVAHGETPYDEVGIALNGYMPSPLRSWGCHKMQARFANQLPPYGCAGPDGRSWL